MALGKKIAVKVLAAELAASTVVIERFFREARAAASVRSPHIVDVYDSGRLEDGRPFIAMEMLEGESLYERMARIRIIAVRSTVQIIRPLLQGAHEGPRRWHHPPRSQAREHLPRHRRGGRGDRQDPRFRPRQVLRAARHRREGEPPHARGRGLRDAGVHEPRAGEGAGLGRPPRRSVGARLHDVRVSHRPPGVEHRSGRGHDLRRHRHRHHAGAEPDAPGVAARLRRVVPASALDRDPDRRFQTANELGDALLRAFNAAAARPPAATAR